MSESRRIRIYFVLPMLVLLLGLATYVAIKLTTPTPPGSTLTVTVVAGEGWQHSDILLEPGRKVTIEYLDGLWFEDPPGRWHDAGGGPNPWTCTSPQCHEPMKTFPKYAVIGRVGTDGTLLPVGKRFEFMVNSSGSLYLRPNYGEGDMQIHRPLGSVRLKVTIS